MVSRRTSPGRLSLPSANEPARPLGPKTGKIEPCLAHLPRSLPLLQTAGGPGGPAWTARSSAGTGPWLCCRRQSRGPRTCLHPKHAEQWSQKPDHARHRHLDVQASQGMQVSVAAPQPQDRGPEHTCIPQSQLQLAADNCCSLAARSSGGQGTCLQPNNL